MKITVAVLCGLLLCVVLLAGCQPTPDKPAVVNKGDGRMEEKIAQSPAPAKKYEAPAHWKETYTRDRLTVEFDADITLPNADKYPVVKVEPVTLSQQRVDELVNYFAGGKKLYRYPAVKTKAEYAAEIVEAKRGQEVDGKFVVTEDSKAWVKELEQRMSQAPDTYQREYVDTTLDYQRDFQSGKENTEYGKNFLSVAVETGEFEDPEIYYSIFAQSPGDGTFFNYCRPNEDGTRETYYLQEIKNDPYGIRDMDEAQKKKYEDIYAGVPESLKEDYLAKAWKVLDDLQVKDMMLVGSDKVALQGITGSKPPKGGYVFDFARACGGIPVYIPNGGGRNKGEEPPAYTIPFDPERVIVTVAGGEIESFRWNGQSRATETLTENVELLPFDQLKDKVRNQIYYKESFNLSYVQSLTVHVTSMELRMQYVPVKDHPGQTLIVPAWILHTLEMRTVYNDTLDPEKGVKVRQGNREDYMFNAIDGGVIEINMD